MSAAHGTQDVGEREESARRAYEDLRETLQSIVGDFADEQDISSKMLALLLVDLGVGSYMADYLMRTEKPSSLGLKLELDRFGREIDDFIRSSKKSADSTVARIKDYLNTVERQAADVPSAA